MPLRLALGSEILVLTLHKLTKMPTGKFSTLMTQAMQLLAVALTLLMDVTEINLPLPLICEMSRH